MQKSDSEESGSKQDNALAILDNLSRALASKENNELGFKGVRNGNDSFSAKCNVCTTNTSLGQFSKNVYNLEIHCQS